MRCISALNRRIPYWTSFFSRSPQFVLQSAAWADTPKGKHMAKQDAGHASTGQRRVMLSRDDKKSGKTSIELRNDSPPVSP